MATITVVLPQEDLEFLQAYSQALGTSAEVVLAQQARTLRELHQKPLHPDIIAASGIIHSSIEGQEAHRDHVCKKQA